MNKKLLFILPLFALVSCSYGGITEISNDAFKDFYNRGALRTQKDYEFKLGDDISVAMYAEDEGEGDYLTYELATSSINKWQTDGLGNKLSYYAYKLVLDLDTNDTEVSEFDEGSLSFSSRIISEEDDDGNVIVVGKKDIYSSSHLYESALEGDSFDEAKEYALISLEREVGTYYESLDDEGKEFDTDYLYKDYSYTFEYKSKEVNIEGDNRVTTEDISSTVIQYREYYSGHKFNLDYVFSSVVKETTEVKSEGVYVGSTRVVDEENNVTTARVGSPAEVDEGKSIVSHTEYIYSEGSYHKDDEHSTRSEDDTYRYTLSDTFTSSYEVSALLESFSTNLRLIEVMSRITESMKGLFVAFEEKMNDEQEKKEIIHFADTYQYRIQADDAHILQYTFVDGGGEKDRLTNIIVFEVGSDKSLTEISKTSIIY